MSHGSAGIAALGRIYTADVLADQPLWADLLAQTSGTSLDGDYSGFGHSGSIDPGVTFSTAPVSAQGFSKAWSLNAYEGGGLVGASWMAPSGPTPAALAGFTAEIWVELVSWPANVSGNRQYILMARSDVNGANLISNKAWSIQVLPSGAVSGRLWSSLGNTQTFTSAAAAIPLNTPCHVILSHDGTTVRCRVNKVQVASVSLLGPPVTFAQNTQPLTLGKDSTNGAAGGWNFNGKMWAPAYYGYDLSAARADVHYDTGMAIA